VAAAVLAAAQLFADLGVEWPPVASSVADVAAWAAHLEELGHECAATIVSVWKSRD
jgi:hypothetical protein